MASERFPKARRVRRRDEFQRVFDLSHRAKGRYATVLVAPNEAGTARLGIVASRKLGNAVYRNRAKRVIREVFRRSNTVQFGVGLDVVVIPRRELFDARYSALESDLLATFRGSAGRLAATPNAR